MKLDGVSAIALVLIASFAIDRLVTGTLFLLGMLGLVRDPDAVTANEDRIPAQRRYKLVYYLLAGLLGVVVMSYVGGLRLLSAVLPAVDPQSQSGFFQGMDIVVTGLALMGGAERLSALLKGVAPAPKEVPSEPIQVTGKLTLEESPSVKAMGRGA